MSILSNKDYEEYFDGLLTTFGGKKASIDELEERKQYLMAVLKDLDKPFIQSFEGLRIASFLDKNEGRMVYGLDKYLFNFTDTIDPQKYYLDVLCDEDKEWTKWRNEGLTGIFFKKYMLKPEFQDFLSKVINELIDTINNEIKKQEEIIKEHNWKKEERKYLCKIIKVYKQIKPQGKENGVDGYFECDVLVKESQEVIRVILRDVFDVGVYCFPARVAGTDDVFNWSNWTDDEKTACNWLIEFGDFKNVRM